MVKDQISHHNAHENRCWFLFHEFLSFSLSSKMDVPQFSVILVLSMSFKQRDFRDVRLLEKNCYFLEGCVIIRERAIIRNNMVYR